MPKLNDLEAVLLSAAAARNDRSLLPFPASAWQAGDRLTRALALLLRRGLVDERETTTPAQIHRTDGDLSFGLFVTAEGYTAIGVEVEAPGEGAVAPLVESAKVPAPTKASRVIALLEREQGATLAELIAETGWLPHTTRAALTGLRKKGHVLDKSKRGEVTCYRIVGAA
jgi:hypothetical protein